MRYVIYTVDRNEELFGNAELNDTYIVDNALIRNEHLMNEVQRKSCVQVIYAPIYKSGEYGKRVVVKYKDIVDFRGIPRETIFRNGGII